MNLVETFASYLESFLGIHLKQDLFIGQAPSTNKVPDSIWWIVARGGDKTSSLITGESIKSYLIEIYFRSRDYKLVYDNMYLLEKELNCLGCVTLECFSVLNIEASVLGIDNDLDAEDRKLAVLQANVTVYEDCSEEN